MSTTATRQAEDILKEALEELESPKGRVQIGVQKLLRAARVLGDEDVVIWCEIQLGNTNFTLPLEEATKDLRIEFVALSKELEQLPAEKKSTKGQASSKRPSKKAEEAQKEFEAAEAAIKKLDGLGLKESIHYSQEERRFKTDKAGGGYQNIGTVEDIYNSLLRKKVGNDRTHYQINLSNHINYVRRTAHEKATRLYNRLAFANTPQTVLDILRAEVDSKLLDLAPEVAEKLMVAFKSVGSESPEEWSQALTTCRRFLEALADSLYPAREEKVNGREVGKLQYINRLWAFMDNAIESESNKELAKSHISYLGKYLEKTHTIGHKGVHANLKRIEAVKAVFHTYLVAADILDYLKKGTDDKNKKLNIHTATLDELESILDVSRNIAKEIIKLRVQYGIVDLARLTIIKGIGKKTLSRAEQVLSFEPIK